MPRSPATRVATRRQSRLVAKRLALSTETRPVPPARSSSSQAIVASSAICSSLSTISSRAAHEPALSVRVVAAA